MSKLEEIGNKICELFGVTKDLSREPSSLEKETKLN